MVVTHIRTRPPLLLSTLLFAVGGLGAEAAAGADWPQLGGPGRDYRVPAPALATSWAESEPKVLWERPLGLGYSGISVVADRLYTMTRRGEDEVVLGASTATGETVWEHRYAAPFAEFMRMEHGSGPHVTPLVLGDLVFTVGIRGRLLAFDRTRGDVRWKQELMEEWGGSELERGYSSSPLAYRDWLLVQVGGRGQAVVAFHQASGEVAWKGGDWDASFSSPILIDVDGQTQLVVLTREELVGVDPESGRRLWVHPHPTQYGLNISVPVWGEGNLLFASSAYNGGSRILRLRRGGERTEIEELWAHKQMRIHIGNAIRIGSHLYGSNGDFGPVPFTAVDVRSGEIAWRTRDVGRAFAVLADGKLILLDEDGVLRLATATPEGLEIHAERAVFQERAWTPPTLVGRTLYMRDTARMVAMELP